MDGVATLPNAPIELGLWLLPIGLIAVLLVSLAKSTVGKPVNQFAKLSYLSEVPIDATSALFTFALGISFVKADHLGISLSLGLLILLFCMIQIVIFKFIEENKLRWSETSAAFSISWRFFVSYLLFLTALSSCIYIFQSVAL